VFDGQFSWNVLILYELDRNNARIWNFCRALLPAPVIVKLKYVESVVSPYAGYLLMERTLLSRADSQMKVVSCPRNDRLPTSESSAYKHTPTLRVDRREGNIHLDSISRALGRQSGRYYGFVT
jgi:hypothetical protein